MPGLSLRIVASSLVLAPLFGGLGCDANASASLGTLFDLEEIVLPPSLSSCTKESARAACGADDQCTRTIAGGTFCELPTSQYSTSFSVRNVGTPASGELPEKEAGKITIQKVEFIASDNGDGFENFTEPEFDRNELFYGDVASLAFKYITPDLFRPYFAQLVIRSDAANDPVAIDVRTAFLPQADSGGEGEGEGE